MDSLGLRIMEHRRIGDVRDGDMDVGGRLSGGEWRRLSVGTYVLF